MFQPHLNDSVSYRPHGSPSSSTKGSPSKNGDLHHQNGLNGFHGDAGYDSYSLSSNDSYPLQQSLKHTLQVCSGTSRLVTLLPLLRWLKKLTKFWNISAVADSRRRTEWPSVRSMAGPRSRTVSARQFRRVRTIVFGSGSVAGTFQDPRRKRRPGRRFCRVPIRRSESARRHGRAVQQSADAGLRPDETQHVRHATAESPPEAFGPTDIRHFDGRRKLRSRPIAADRRAASQPPEQPRFEPQPSSDAAYRQIDSFRHFRSSFVDFWIRTEHSEFQRGQKHRNLRHSAQEEGQESGGIAQPWGRRLPPSVGIGTIRTPDDQGHRIFRIPDDAERTGQERRTQKQTRTHSDQSGQHPAGRRSDRQRRRIQRQFLQVSGQETAPNPPPSADGWPHQTKEPKSSGSQSRRRGQRTGRKCRLCRRDASAARCGWLSAGRRQQPESGEEQADAAEFPRFTRQKPSRNQSTSAAASAEDFSTDSAQRKRHRGRIPEFTDQ